MDQNAFSNDRQPVPPETSSHSVSDNQVQPPPVPDHQLLRRIGRGSYGTVWLARNMLGMHRAVKIVYRKSFKDERPFKRELSGIQKFEPISRSHEGFVDVLQVGINKEQGYFYYVMELGDDQVSEQKIDPENYAPRTLGKDISLQGSLPMQDCLQLGLALTQALAELHKHGLVHRDIKPSNIIFVNRVPKLADIGLVAEVNDARSYVGTEGFIPPEGPGTAQADLYSLGKVLYEASTGKDRQDFPELPTQLDRLADPEPLLELNEVILHACKSDVTKRYRSAWEMHADLVVLVNGKSVRRLKVLEQRFSRLKRIAGISFGILALLIVCLYLAYQSWKGGMELRQRQVGENVAYGNRAVESGDFLEALPYFAEAMRLDQGNAREQTAHRLLFGSALAQCPKLNQMWFMGGEVRDGTFSADGGKVMIPEYSGSTRIFDFKNGTLCSPAFGNKRWVGSAALSPDGAFAVTASEENMACVWDIASSALVCSLPHPEKVMSARFSPDGLWIATAGYDGLARLWDAHSGQLKLLLKGHTKVVRFADFSHDGQLVVTASEDQTARLWNAGTGRSVGIPLVHPSWVNYAAFSPDNQLMITACADHKARIWEVATGRRLLVDLNHRDGVQSAQFSPDGRRVVTASLDGTARIWQLDNVQSITATLVLRHSAGVTHAAFSSDGHHIITTCTDGSVRVWDLAGSAVAPLGVQRLISEDGSRFLTFTNNRLAVWDAASEQPILPLISPCSPSNKIKLTRNGRFVLSLFPSATNASGTSRLLEVWNTTTGQATAPGFRVSNAFNKTALSEDGKRSVTFGGRQAEIWDMLGRTNLSPLLSFDEPVESACFSPDGNRVAIKYGKTLQVRDASGQLVFPPLMHSRPIVHTAFSPNGSLLVTCCSDDQIHKCCAQLWDAATGRPGPELWHNDGVLFAAFSPDGKRVVTASEDYTAKIWDTATGKQLTPDLKHEDRVRTVVFSPDGNWIVTASDDKTVRVWSSTTGDPLTPPLRHLALLTSAQFLSDGHRVIASDKQGNSWIWDLPLERGSQEDLRKLAHLLSGKTIASATSPNGKRSESMETLWQELHAKYPASFATAPQETASWHEFEAEACEKEKKWSAAAFHLERLLSARPSDPSLGERLARAKEYGKCAN